jgi:hypothetical protein
MHCHVRTTVSSAFTRERVNSVNNVGKVVSFNAMPRHQSTHECSEAAFDENRKVDGHLGTDVEFSRVVSSLASSVSKHIITQ